jgi:hypothetical protein
MNTFRNNIVYLNNNVSVQCNIGPNTAPETFTFSNNLWYHADNSNWAGPVLPVTDDNNIVGEDPLFTDSGTEEFSLIPNSPAIGHGFDVSQPLIDFTGVPFHMPRSIVAFEGEQVSAISTVFSGGDLSYVIYPNPATDFVTIQFESPLEENILISLMSQTGIGITKMMLYAGESTITIPVQFHQNIVYIVFHSGHGMFISPIIRMR